MMARLPYSSSRDPERVADCSDCGAPDRRSWVNEGPAERPPGSLPDIQIVRWMALVHCPSCDARWVEVPTGPHDTITSLVRWPLSDTDFATLAKRDDAEALHAWHQRALLEDELNRRTADRRIPWPSKVIRSLRTALSENADAPTDDKLRALLEPPSSTPR